MMKKYIYVIFFFLLLFVFSGCYSKNSINRATNSKNSNSYKTSILSIKKPVEENLYSFSTEILDKSEGRQNNIRLTCSTLNGTIVKSGSEFSFCNTVGPATTDKGYQEAKIFGADGEVTMGLGGGNCQISSTLYNAVLQDANFEILERHPHAQKVYYVEERKRRRCCLWKCGFQI